MTCLILILFKITNPLLAKALEHIQRSVLLSVRCVGVPPHRGRQIIKRQKTIRRCEMTSPCPNTHTHTCTYTHAPLHRLLDIMLELTWRMPVLYVCACACAVRDAEKVWNVWLLIHLPLHTGWFYFPIRLSKVLRNKVRVSKVATNALMCFCGFFSEEGHMFEPFTFTFYPLPKIW